MSERGLSGYLCGWIGLLALLPAVVFAQENRAGEVETADVPAERIIYVPFKQLEDVLDQQDASVVLPYADYLKLWTRPAPQTGAEVSAVITRAEYQARVAEDIARITATLTIEVIGKPWVEVPLDFGDAAVGDLSSETGEVLLRGTGEGTYVLLLKTPGTQQVTIELTTRVVTSPEGREIQLSTPSVAVSTLELFIPQADQEVEVRPRLISLPIDDAADPSGDVTRVKASVGATGRVTARWHARASAKPQMELLANVTNLQRVRIADGLVHTDATLKYSILRGELEQLRVAVPRDVRILDVSASARVQKWQATAEQGRQVIAIDLLAPVSGELTLEVHTESRLADGPLSVAGLDESGATHGIHALDVVRESGQLVVSHGDELTLRVLDQSGLVRIESAEVAKSIRQEAGLSYKFFNPRFALQLSATPVEPRVSVVQRARVDIDEEHVRLQTQLNYTIERAGLFELQIRLPAELDNVRVESAQMEEYRVEDETLVVALQQRMTGTVQVTISGQQSLPADGESFDLPLPEPLNVEREQGTVQLLARDAVEVTTNEDELLSALPDPLAGGRRPPQLRASWRFARRPVRIPVTITQKPTRLSARVATDVDVQPARTRVTTSVDFRVEYAGLDTFRIDVPVAALPTLQIEAVASDPASPALRETTLADPVDGWVTHTLTMQRPVLGRQRFRLTYDLTPSEPQPPEAVANRDGVAITADAARTDNTAAETSEGSNAAEGPSKTKPGNESEEQDQPAERVDAPSTDDTAEPPAVDQAAEPAPSNADDTGADTDGTPPETDEAEADEVDGMAEVPRLQTVVRLLRPLGSFRSTEAEQTTPLTSVTGEVRLDKEESLTITAEASGADIEPIDVRELTLLPAQGTLAFRYRQHAAEETIELRVTQARYDVQEMLATVVSRALVEVMLGDDETATFRCRYRIQSTERQRLPLRLPRGVVPLTVLVNDSEVRLEPVGVGGEDPIDTYYVNVARPGESDEPFHLTLQYLFSFNEPPFDTGFMRGRINVPLPVIGADDGSAATQELRAIVWVPQEYALIGDPSGFVLDGQSLPLSALLGGAKQVFPSRDDDTWVGCTSSGLDFPTTGRVQYRYTNLGGESRIKPLWWDTVRVTIVVSVTLAVIALLLLRTDWENKLGILLLILFGALLLGLKDMHVLAHALSAMRFGLLFMIGLWALHALFGQRQPHIRAATPSPAAGVRSATPPHAAAVPPPGVFDHFLSPKSARDDDLN